MLSLPRYHSSSTRAAERRLLDLWLFRFTGWASFATADHHKLADTPIM